ncbi:MAG: patatin-like phospholipase family protein [Candidatus Eremiobacteraeota bacterium]|nr:patatin-like phospholipase family protein [Candidatus Eremiobacteraeota bacterium]
MKRKAFLAASASAAVAAASPAVAPSQQQARAARKALVLVGGVNRGAYQAGVIQALVEKAGLRDGEPLDYDLVCGTSIGALNGYFVSTAQYALLKDLWLSGISSGNVFRFKSPYNKIKNTDSGILSRLSAAVSLGTGLTSNVTGVFDPVPVQAMLDQYIDPSLPVHVPAYIATTNLSQQKGQIFVRHATTSAGMQKQAINDALLAKFPVKNALSNSVPATNGILRQVYFATACLPLAFDPVKIERDDGSGKIDQFVDGGVTANAPITIAQLCATTLEIVLVDPPRKTPHVIYDNAFDVGTGVFETMQQRLLFYQVLLAFAAAKNSLPFDPYVMQPASELPGKLGDFNDQPSLTASWKAGYNDAASGWRKFEFPYAAMLQPFED